MINFLSHIGKGENEIGILPPRAYFTPPFIIYILIYFKRKNYFLNIYS